MRERSKSMWWIPALLVLLAAVLRMHRLDLIDFRFDQAYPLWYAQDIAAGRLWGMQPHGSVGAHPAAYLYVMALPYLFTKNFFSVVVYRVFFDVLTTAMVYAIGRRYFAGRVGWIGALLYAVAPWPIEFARNLWPVCQPLFSAVLMIGLLEIAVRRNPRGWFIAGLGLSLTAGTHLGGVYLLPVMLFAAWIGRRSLRWKPLLFGLIPGVLLAAAYVIQDVSGDFGSLRAYFGAVGGGAAWRPEVFERIGWLSGGAHLGVLTGAAYGVWTAVPWNWGAWIDDVQVIGMAAACAYAVWIVLRRRSVPALILLAWVFVPAMIQFHSSRPVEVQYLTSLLPAPALLMAYVFDRCMSLGRALRVAAVAVVALLCGWQIVTTLHFHDIVDRFDTKGGYGQPVRSVLAARAELLKLNTGSDAVVVVQGFPTPWNEPAVILRAVLADVPYRFFNSESDGLIFTGAHTQYVVAPGAEPLLEMLRGAGAHEFSVPSRVGSGGRFTYAQIDGLPGELPAAPQARWESGLLLRGARVQRESNALRVEVQFEVTTLPPEGADYHWYFQAFVGDEKRAGVDIAGVHPASWRVGDLLLLHATIPLDRPLPTGPYRVRFGSYTYPEIAPVTVQQPDKQPDNGVDLWISD
ncbi:MAG: glycosyltransferase family 39 protein [Chloroflexi bacterium]|nr:glycosyltransferase family 39 protein [Chloroflexota bacterium]